MNGRSDALDALRGVAILLVMASHHWGFEFGLHGVDLFFVLSGFLVGGILMDHRDADNYFSTFYMRRAFRILPLYWVYLGFIAMTVGLSLPAFDYAVFGQGIVAVAAHRQTGPEAITWSLAVEEQAYLLFPAVVFITPTRRLPWVLAALFMLAPLSRWALATAAGTLLAAWVILPGHLDAFAAGAGAAWLLRQRHLGPSRVDVAWPIAVVAAVGYLGIEQTGNRLLSLYYGWSFLSLAFAGAVLAAALLPRLPLLLRPLAWLGVISYAVYLTHDAAGMWFGPFWPVATLIVATASWLALERPLLTRARQRWRYVTGASPDIFGEAVLLPMTVHRHPAGK